MASTKQWVWVQDPRGLWVAARLIEEDADFAKMQTMSGDRLSFPRRMVGQFDPVAASTMRESLDDLEDLREAHEGAVLLQLQKRFRANTIYTKCGERLLISINPYKFLQDMYERDQIIRAQRTFRPHIYTFTGRIYRSLLSTVRPSEPEPANSTYKTTLRPTRSHSLIVLGERASGKTEITKMISLYISEVSRYNERVAPLSTPQLMAAERLVEAFLGATHHSPHASGSNASRFLQFTIRPGKIVGYITHFLLHDYERITNAPPRQRSYHIFYQLLAGAAPSTRESLALDAGETASSFAYLSKPGALVHVERPPVDHLATGKNDGGGGASVGSPDNPSTWRRRGGVNPANESDLNTRDAQRAAMLERHFNDKGTTTVDGVELGKASELRQLQQDLQKQQTKFSQQFRTSENAMRFPLIRVSDRHRFSLTSQAMQELGMTHEQRLAVFRLLGAILHIGNVTFETGIIEGGTEGMKATSATDETDGISDVATETTPNNAPVSAPGKTYARVIRSSALPVAKTLQVDVEALVQVFQTYRIASKVLNLTVEQAVFHRDQIARQLYRVVIDYIQECINTYMETLVGGNETQTAVLNVVELHGSVSRSETLDDSLQRLCINYCNEKMYKLLTETVTASLEEYMREVEKLPTEWEASTENSKGATRGNSAALWEALPTELLFDTVERSTCQRLSTSMYACSVLLFGTNLLKTKGQTGPKPSRNFYNLNQTVESTATLGGGNQSRAAQLEDTALLHEMFSTLSATNGRDQDQFRLLAHDPLGFAITHYHCDVQYNGANFAQRNRVISRLDDAFDMCMTTSKCRVLNELYQARVLGLKQSSTTMTTLVQDTRKTINEWIDRIEVSQTYYVLCIKPNETHRPDAFHPHVVARQLSTLGISHYIQRQFLISPYRFQHNEFVKRYRLLEGTQKLKETRPKTSPKLSSPYGQSKLNSPSNEKDQVNALIEDLEQKGLLEATAVRGIRVGRYHVYLTKLQYQTLEQLRAEASVQKARLVLGTTMVQQSRRGDEGKRPNPNLVQSKSRRLSPNPTIPLDLQSFIGRQHQKQLVWSIERMRYGTLFSTFTGRDITTLFNALAVRPLTSFSGLRDLEDYAKYVYFNRKLVKAQAFQFQVSVIPRSLTQFAVAKKSAESRLLKEKAIWCFRNILTFTMPGRYSGNAETVLVDTLNEAVQRPLLRDEIFCQLIKQTLENPEKECELLTWKLIYFCLLRFPPESEELVAILKSHVAQNASPIIRQVMRFDTVKSLASNCFQALLSWENRRRPLDLGDFHLERRKEICEWAPLLVTLYGIDGRHTQLGLSPFATSLTYEQTMNTAKDRLEYHDEEPVVLVVADSSQRKLLEFPVPGQQSIVDLVSHLEGEVENAIGDLSYAFIVYPRSSTEASAPVRLEKLNNVVATFANEKVKIVRHVLAVASGNLAILEEPKHEEKEHPSDETVIPAPPVQIVLPATPTEEQAAPRNDHRLKAHATSSQNYQSLGQVSVILPTPQDHQRVPTPVNINEIDYVSSRSASTSSSSEEEEKQNEISALPELQANLSFFPLSRAPSTRPVGQLDIPLRTDLTTTISSAKYRTTSEEPDNPRESLLYIEENLRRRFQAAHSASSSSSLETSPLNAPSQAAPSAYLAPEDLTDSSPSHVKAPEQNLMELSTDPGISLFTSKNVSRPKQWKLDRTHLSHLKQ